MENKPYITDDCVIKDETYFGFQNLVKCDICQKILKDPMMCKNCQKVFCKSCIEREKSCPNKNCMENEFVESKDKKVMLSMLKFLCSNCKEEIKYEDVEKHLSSGCKKRENELRLSDSFYKRKALKKLTPEEIAEARNKGHKIYQLSGKIKILFKFNIYLYL